jgi:hypothetical protein
MNRQLQLQEVLKVTVNNGHLFILVIGTVPLNQGVVLILSKQNEVRAQMMISVIVCLDEDVVLLFEVVVSEVAVDSDFGETVDVDGAVEEGGLVFKAWAS